MSEQKSQWPATCDRFVAFLDIMGFKETVFRYKHEEVLQKMEQFRTPIREMKKEAKRILETNMPPPKESPLFRQPIIKPVLFSDSILLVSNDASLASAEYILAQVKRVVANALLHGMGIKGAVAYGEQTADFGKSLHLGRPLIDACELQNELYLYGVVLHHSMELYLNSQGVPEELKGLGIFKYPTPLKGGIVNHYLVNWTESPEIALDLEGMLSKLYCNVSGTARTYVDNTVKFIDFAKKLQSTKAKGRSSGSPIVKKVGKGGLETNHG